MKNSPTSPKGRDAPASEELRLHAYADGELAPGEASALEERLAADPELRSRYEQILALRRVVEADRAVLPPYRGPRPWAVPLSGTELVAPEWRQWLIPFREAVAALLSPAWARVAAAGVAFLAAAAMGLRQGQAPGIPAVAATSAGVAVLSVELPEAGTGVCMMQVPEENLTVLWVTGLTYPSLVGPGPAEEAPS